MKYIIHLVIRHLFSTATKPEDKPTLTPQIWRTVEPDDRMEENKWYGYIGNELLKTKK